MTLKTVKNINPIKFTALVSDKSNQQWSLTSACHKFEQNILIKQGVKVKDNKNYFLIENLDQTLLDKYQKKL